MYPQSGSTVRSRVVLASRVRDWASAQRLAVPRSAARDPEAVLVGDRPAGVARLGPTEGHIEAPAVARAELAARRSSRHFHGHHGLSPLGGHHGLGLPHRPGTLTRPGDLTARRDPSTRRRGP